jgi:predicted HTH transcriptional regulator
MSKKESDQQRAKEWSPSISKPKELYESPDIKLLCAEKIENQFYDRKSKQKPQRIAEVVSSFANINVEGGLISIGISDDGIIEGVLHRPDMNVNEILTYQSQAGILTNHKFVDCKNSKGIGDQILLIYVPYAPDKVVETSSGDAFIRIGDQTHKLNYAQRRDLEYKKGQSSYEDEIGCLFKQDELADDVLNEFQKSVRQKDKHAIPHSVEEVLSNCHLLKIANGNNYLTKAGLLLFYKDPTKHIPGAYLRFLRYHGREKKAGTSQNVIKDEMFYGPVPKLIQKAVDYIQTQVKEFSYLGEKGKFVTEPEYPEFAWTEAVVNALIHRSYSQCNAPIFMEMFDDRIEIISPGEYPVGITPDQFFHNPRNPHLMNAMRYLEFVKMAAEGIQRIKQEMETAGLPPPIYSPPGQPNVKVILRNDIDRREARIVKKEEASEFSNLFEVKVTGSIGSEGAIIDGKGATIQKIRKEFESKLRLAGWAIDSFTNDTAINLSEKYAVEEIDDYVSIYPGFRYIFRKLNDLLVLTIDPTIEVRNRATLKLINEIAPEMLSWGVFRGYAKIDSNWKACVIKNIEEESVRLFIKNSEEVEASEISVPLENVVPSIPTRWLSYLIRKAKLRTNLYKIIQKQAFSTSKNAARLRAEETLKLVNRLRKTIFPLDIDSFKIELVPEPVKLKDAFKLHKDLVETEPIFDSSNPKSASTVIEGLSQYGSYERPEKEIPLVILITDERSEEMKSLIKTIIHGSYKYRGAEKTFSVNLKQLYIETTGSCDDYLKKCEEILRDIPEKAVFIIYCPEEIYGKEDYQSPYYRVKHYLLEKGYPSQMIDEETLLDQRFKDFNIALDIFAKSGYVPWVLSEGMPNADLFLGISYSTVGRGPERKRVLAYINVFDRYGKWLYYRGNAKPIRFEERNRAFREILEDIVQDYEKRASLQRLHVHSAFKLSFESRKEIADGVWKRAPQAEVSFVHINDLSNIRLYDKRSMGDGSLSRGAYVVINPNHFFISTTGYNELGQKGIGTPRTLEVKVNRLGSKGDLDPRIYAQHILSLTKLNWASTKSFCRDPITLKYSRDIAYLMAAFLKSFDSFKIHPRLEKTPWFL